MDINKKLATDVHKRKAKLFLCVRPTTSLSVSTSGENPLSYIHPGLAHWVLSIDFGEGKVIYVEGNNVDGKLVPSIHDRSTCWLSEKSYGSKYLSPSELYNLLFQNPLNFTDYDPLYNNCQHWFTAMTKLLKIQDNNEEPYCSRDLAIGAGVGFFGIAALCTLKLFSGSNKNHL